MSVKKLLLAVVVMVLAAAPVLALGQSAEAAPSRQGEMPAQTITVTGRGVAYGAPDVARIGLGVEASNQDVLQAMDDANARMNAVMQALTDGGVAPEDIRTENFSIYQDYGYGGPVASGMEGDQPKPSYRVTNGVSVTVRDTSKVGELLAAVVAAGANMVNYVQFDIDDRAALESDARGLAVADARARAEELAGMLGLAVGKPLSVSENSDYYGSPLYGLGGGGGMAESAAPISQGQLSVSMAVTITFELVAP